MGGKTKGVGEFVYLNGAFVRAAEAALSPFDRGFLLAHAAYEVTAIYGGKLIDWPAHAARLERTLDGIGLPMPAAPDALKEIHLELMARNSVEEGLVYLQATGGAYGFRDFAGPETFEPGLFLFSTAKSLIGEAARDGLHAITVPDERWARRDWKTTQLLSQALAYRKAYAAGADTAWMHEDGMITEAASANAWIATGDGALVTRDLSAAILPGITRETVAWLLRAEGLTVEERAFSVEEARAAQEAFTTSTGVVIAPILSLDGAPIGDGQPGRATRMVQRLYYGHMGADVAEVAPWALG